FVGSVEVYKRQDFVYTPEEIAVMECDIEEAVKSGVCGVVIGALTPDGHVDVETCRRLLKKAEGLDNTFHRAFDLTADPLEALEEIIALGFNRILTSGQAATALEGAALIAELHRRAKGRIKIMAGAGVNPSNITEILALSNADEAHASARSRHLSAMQSCSKATMGSADASDGSRLATDPEIVGMLRRAIDSF
ncbi:MAG: copper homeostasis protein CutC, partial [Muribaculaceae bacterium]|nr:copper homeostasis protein CutC [Muribaculaceae bacterium]